MASTTGPDGNQLHYEVAGGDASHAVMLVHGITESAQTWAPIVERLAADYRVVALDLRGHGQSASADRYDLEAMAGDVVAVALAENLDRPHMVGHSLGGAVVSAVGAAMPVASVTNVDQSLQLGAFKEGLQPAEPLLRDPASFDAVIDGLFADLAGSMLDESEFARVTAARRPDQQVVLGVWELIFSMSVEEINGVVEGALAGYAGSSTPYLSLFGIDPGPDYAAWLATFIDNSDVELWADHGHYPHLVDPDRFVARVVEHWSS